MHTVIFLTCQVTIYYIFTLWGSMSETRHMAATEKVPFVSSGATKSCYTLVNIFSIFFCFIEIF